MIIYVLFYWDPRANPSFVDKGHCELFFIGWIIKLIIVPRFQTFFWAQTVMENTILKFTMTFTSGTTVDGPAKSCTTNLGWLKPFK
jgi:hypothetical protein